MARVVLNELGTNGAFTLPSAPKLLPGVATIELREAVATVALRFPKLIIFLLLATMPANGAASIFCITTVVNDELLIRAVAVVCRAAKAGGVVAGRALAILRGEAIVRRIGPKEEKRVRTEPSVIFFVIQEPVRGAGMRVQPLCDQRVPWWRAFLFVR